MKFLMFSEIHFVSHYFLFVYFQAPRSPSFAQVLSLRGPRPYIQGLLSPASTQVWLWSPNPPIAQSTFFGLKLWSRCSRIAQSTFFGLKLWSRCSTKRPCSFSFDWPRCWSSCTTWRLRTRSANRPHCWTNWCSCARSSHIFLYSRSLLPFNRV